MTAAWHRVDEVPDEGRVRTAVVDGRSVALTRCGGRVGALDNRPPADFSDGRGGHGVSVLVFPAVAPALLPRSPLPDEMVRATGEAV
jgi:hypothetical protein